MMMFSVLNRTLHREVAVTEVILMGRRLGVSPSWDYNQIMSKAAICTSEEVAAIDFGAANSVKAALES